MSLLDYFRSRIRPSSATAAKERLQIIVAHERGGHQEPDFLPAMRKDILAVISKYIVIDQDQVNVHFDDSTDCSILELNIALPETPTRKGVMPSLLPENT